MGFLTLGSGPGAIDIPVAPGSVMHWVTIEDRQAAFDGTMRSIPIARKRKWTIKTPKLDQATYIALRAALLASPKNTISGDWPAATVTVWPSVQKDTPNATAPFREVVSCTLEEA